MKRTLHFVFLLGFIALTYYSCKKQDDDFIINKDLKADSIIRISSIQPATAFADSNSKIIIRVQINSYTDSAVNVTLTTSSGIINSKSRSESMRVNVNRYADFILTSGHTPGPVTLRATVLGTFYRDTILTFAKAYPDTVLVYPEAYTVTMNSSVAASIQLIRKIGRPSFGQTIFLSSLDANGNNLGRFTYGGTYSPGETITASFSPPVDYVGKVVLQATVLREDGTRIIGKNTIDIQ
ncbi:hypothetical protein [Pedobacter panaciterrae]|uniref:hypothetical protein n=1 Tax=Pedobacter panaciterrae TaxID=363849 RepID=UPI0025944833|nr:hypothetical protein [uncultured Pedobacter sp.]